MSTEFPIQSPENLPLPADTILPSELSTRDKLKSIVEVAKQDYKSAGRLGQAVLAGTVAMTAYEWGPGNEAVTPMIVGPAVDAAGGLKGVAITSAVGFAFTYVQQRASAFLTRRTAQRFPRTSQKSFEIIKGEDKELSDGGLKPFFEQSRTEQLTSSFLIGSSWNTAREVMLTGNLDDDHLKKVGKRSALVTATAVACVAAAFDTLDQVVPDDTLAQSVVDFFKSPTPYLIGVVAYFGNEYRKSKK